MRFRALAFVASFLLFQVELIVARILLPTFGSSASVWTTCLVFYQGALFVGYLYAQRASARIPDGRYRWAHAAVVVLPALTFPFRWITVDAHPALAVAVALALSVGLAFVALSTTTIIAQSWLAASGDPAGADPHFLYGMSNAGALVGLLSYPFAIEPALGTDRQLHLWYAGYAVFVLLVLACVPKRRTVNDHAHPSVASDEAARGPFDLEPGVRASWLLFPMAANALLLAAMHAITLDASVPLVWVLPLALYLVTLIVCFGRAPLSRRAVNGLIFVAVALAMSGTLGVGREAAFQTAMIALHAAVLFAGCLILHWHLSQVRPPPGPLLGRYYLAIALGGWAGATLVGIGAPLVFRNVGSIWVDYVLAGGLALVAFAARHAGGLWRFARARPLLIALIAGGSLSTAFLATTVVLSRQEGAIVEARRTFYGLYTVKDQDGLRWFLHGNTVHGVESLTARGVPMAYYADTSPITTLLQSLDRRERVAVVGLGTGALAARSREGERWDFYELDAEVERLARAHFAFLRAAPAEVDVRIGDARLTLGGAPDQAYDAIVVDAFSSDFVPIHLITLEALALYERKLRPGGVLVFHISNRIFELEPVLTRAADALELRAAYGEGAMARARGFAAGQFQSKWYAMTRDDAALARLVERGWRRVQADAALRARRPWTDAYVNIFHALP